MNKARLLRRLIGILGVLAIGAGLAWWLTRSKPIAVNLVAVDRGTVEETVANTRAGSVTACHRSKLSPAIGGQIERLPVHKGEQVREGDVLLELWNDDLKAQLSLAGDELVAARNTMRSACLRAENAEREAARQQSLRKSGLTSEERADQATTEARAGAAECSAAEATVSESQARVALARANLARTILTAPFDGIVADINGEVDEYVTPSPPGIPTLPVIDLIDNSCYYVEAPIDEVDAAKVRVGMPVKITLDAFGKRDFKGTVTRIGAYVVELEKQARTVDVDVGFDDPTDLGRLLAGYSADVEIVLDRHDNGVRVPSEAVVNGDQVYVYDPRSRRLKLTTFTPGLANWSWTEVASGLEPGEMVVTSVDRKGVADGVRVIVERNEQGG